MIQDMNVNISHAFYYVAAKFSSGNAFVNAVKKAFGAVTVYDENKSFDNPYITDMQTVQSFLHGGGQTYRTYRVFLDDVCPDLTRAGMSGFCTMISYFEESNIIALSFHYGLKGISSDKVIGIRQSGVNKEYDFRGEMHSCTSLAEKIRKALGLLPHVETSYLCEVTKFGDEKTLDDIEEKHVKLLYGLMTGDEGYHFVPEDLVRERLANFWGSRDFMRIYAGRQSFLFINLLKTPRQQAYLDRQTQFGTDTYGSLNPYFYMEDCPLTVNHGILFSVEFAMLLRALINEVLAFQTEYKNKKFISYYKRIRETRELRRKIIKVLEKVEQTKIAEIGELSAVLLASQHIVPIVEQVKYLLELLEGDLTMIYSERNNALMTVLTVLGLLLAVWQVILAL